MVTTATRNCLAWVQWPAPAWSAGKQGMPIMLAPGGSINQTSQPVVITIRRAEGTGFSPNGGRFQRGRAGASQDGSRPWQLRWSQQSTRGTAAVDCANHDTRGGMQSSDGES